MPASEEPSSTRSTGVQVSEAAPRLDLPEAHAELQEAHAALQKRYELSVQRCASRLTEHDDKEG